jgi:hypothetical protein|tara:strand:- start:20 stop:304 length:285 start_codon:yes stop_codon:yes gene_type:complete
LDKQHLQDKPPVVATAALHSIYNYPLLHLAAGVSLPEGDQLVRMADHESITAEDRARVAQLEQLLIALRPLTASPEHHELRAQIDALLTSQSMH